MPVATFLRRFAPCAVAALLTACADAARVAAPPVIRGEPWRDWRFGIFPTDRRSPVNGPFTEQTGGNVHVTRLHGPLFGAPAPDGLARSEVFSSPDGATYGVSTEGQSTRVELRQVQAFRKVARDASLRFVVTRVELRGGIDNNVGVSRDCLEHHVNCATEAANVSLEILLARDTGRTREFAHVISEAYLTRNANRWFFDPSGSIYWGAASGFLWGGGDFVQDFADGTDARRARAALLRPKVVRVDLSEVDVGQGFTVHTNAVAATYKHGGGGETFTHAYLRDPAGVDGTTVEYTGLEPVPVTSTERPPPSSTLGQAPPCAGPTGPAGTLQFSRAAYRQDELPIPGLEPVRVTRTGGGSGRVSATVATSDGTARAGADYESVVGTVAFADGDTLPRTVRVPFVLDTIAEPDETLTLRLSDPRGCATIGAATATLTITDDDRPPIETAFAVGGTVAGLAGGGLVLRNEPGGEELAVGANGAFTFARRTPAGLAYRVVVATQPASPAQVCTVANGSGTMPEAPVSNVAVACTTPAPVGGLDPGFGTGGKVTTPLASGAAEAVVVQPDGRLVVAGRSAVPTTPGGAAGVDFTVLRYHPDGTPDASFGTGGVATAAFPAGRTDEAFGVALQADGRIVVVGQTQLAGGALDFAVARFTTDGRLDASFGTGGLVVTDFGAGSASAQGVVVQPDGRIVVAGHSTVGTGNDFAVARYHADGTPDATFGSGGRVTTNVAGRTDLALAVALAPGGRIVLAGRAEHGDSRGDDFALVRYNADGTPDASFGAGGIVTTDIAQGTQVATGVVVQADGRVVVGGYSGRSTDSFDFALARYNADGTPDPNFGTAGTAVTDLSGQDDFGEGLALQADGKLVLIGRRTSGTLFDLALARYLPNGSPDAGFGTAGKLEVDFFGASDEGRAVAVQPDGRVVGAGSARNGTAPHVALVRVVR